MVVSFVCNCVKLNKSDNVVTMRQAHLNADCFAEFPALRVQGTDNQLMIRIFNKCNKTITTLHLTESYYIHYKG